MSGRTRRWRSAVLALAAAVAFAGGLLVLDSGAHFDSDFGWGAPAFDGDFGWGAPAFDGDFGWGAPAFDAGSSSVR